MKLKFITSALVSAFIIFIIILFIGCSKDEDLGLIFGTQKVDAITQVSAISGGIIDDRGILGSLDISEKGVCWSATNTLPTINDYRTIDGNDKGNFTSYVYAYFFYQSMNKKIGISIRCIKN